MLDGGRNYRRNSQHGPIFYQPEESNLQGNNDRINHGILNNYPPLAHSSIPNPVKSRERRDASESGLSYNPDGTISIQCKFSPETCRNERRRRLRRAGKRLFSLHLKPPAETGSSLQNLRNKYHPGRRAPSRLQNRKPALGKRLFSIKLRDKPATIRRVPTDKPNIYSRAFQRYLQDVVTFADDLKNPYGRPIPPVNRRIAKPRGRRAPQRPRYPRRNPRTGVGKEIFSLFLKPPAPKARSGSLFGGRFRGRHAPRERSIPLRCRFRPDKCGRKGQKLFSITYKGFQNVYPNPFPLIK